MGIFCNNLECKYNSKLDTSINFKYNKHSISLGSDDNKCFGKCTKSNCSFSSKVIETSKSEYKLSICNKEKESECTCSCLHNLNSKCDRSQIYVDEVVINNIKYIVCKCRSDIKISGHIDFSRLGLKKDMF